MDNKVISIFKGKQNLVLGLLIALFLVLIFVQTISVADAHNVTVKDFSIMRPTSVPSQSDVKTVLGIFKSELKDAYSFDHLFNNVYSLFVFGIIAMFLCFSKFNKVLFSKLVVFGYGVYALFSLIFTSNLAYILIHYDSTYIAKIVVAALITIVSLASIVFIIMDLAKDGWLKNVNVHVFLNEICGILVITALAIMFIPFKAGTNSASVMGFMLLPSNYAGGFYNAYKAALGSMTFNTSVIIPIAVFVVGIFAVVFSTCYYKNIVVPVLSIAWSVLVALGCFISPLMAMDSKFIIYLVFAAATIAASVVNLVQHHKANEIYRK